MEYKYDLTFKLTMRDEESENYYTQNYTIRDLSFLNPLHIGETVKLFLEEGRSIALGEVKHIYNNPKCKYGESSATVEVENLLHGGPVYLLERNFDLMHRLYFKPNKDNNSAFGYNHVVIHPRISRWSK